tara:strand:+ start:1415 stop:2350 length:936 start_codon:yes stop_codon:yes gene_type:complete
MKNIKFTIITFYQFKKVKKLENIQNLLKEFCSFHKIKGTIILAEEGINGTLSGLSIPIELLQKKLIEFEFINLEKKISFYDFMPFNRLKIKIKKEIVTFKEPNLNVEKLTGKHVNSLKWNNLINDKNTILIDVRNDFEVKVGSFKGSINPNTKNFLEFKQYIKKNMQIKNNNKIAMFCTGGIRCEKASAYMLKEGFKNVFQLKGGILKYLEDISINKSKWDGECFVFDNRVSIRNGMKPGTFTLCHACRYPVSLLETKSEDYEKGISCPKCVDKISKTKKINLKERNKQIKIAKKKGLYSPFIKYTPSDYS